MTIATDVQKLIYRRTKIVATLGPVTTSLPKISALIAAGVDVFRLNMSHGTHEEHRLRYERIRTASEAAKRTVAILADLCGPKIRVGRFPDGQIELRGGSIVTVTTRDVPGADGLIPSGYAALADDVVSGDRILLDDGNLELAVDSIAGTEITCRVVHGGTLKDKKGMNLPGVTVSAPSLTDKDRVDAAFALELGVDLLALSFVRRAEDVEELRAVCREHGRNPVIVAKIEKPEALTNAAGILAASDAIMVARGDLGVELPPEAVPLAQEQLIHAARVAHKPVIVATQMLESMVENARPTRAEVSDVAGAVRSGADAVMLSAESAVGEHPVRAVRMMDNICRQTEGYLWSTGAFGGYRDTSATIDSPEAVADAVAESTARLSRDLLARVIVAFTRSGHTAAVMSASRPASPIVTASPDLQTARRSALLWGAIPAVADESEATDPQALVQRTLSAHGLGAAGDYALVVRGFHPDPTLSLPTVTVVPLNR